MTTHTVWNIFKKLTGTYLYAETFARARILFSSKEKARGMRKFILINDRFFLLQNRHTVHPVHNQFFLLQNRHTVHNRLSTLLTPREGKKTIVQKSRVVQVAIGLLLSTSLQAAPNVAVSIAPIHSLVAGVMDGVGVPKLLIPVGQSPHTYALRPSAVKHIYDADLIIWIGSDYEIALNSVINQARKKGLTYSLGSLGALKTYPVRAGAFWESDAHDDTDDTDDTDDKHNGHEKQSPHQEFIDPHVWLSTANAKTMVNLFRTWLTAIDSENAAIYQSNAERLILRINLLQSHLQQQLKSVGTIPYIVFHDAYQYFEKEFDLNPLGSIILNSEISPGVKRIQALREMIVANGVKCLFNEPQFESKLIPTLIENTDVSLGQLDPLGTDRQLGAELWFELMTEMARSLSDCL